MGEILLGSQPLNSCSFSFFHRFPQSFKAKSRLRGKGNPSNLTHSFHFGVRTTSMPIAARLYTSKTAFNSVLLNNLRTPLIPSQRIFYLLMLSNSDPYYGRVRSHGTALLYFAVGTF